MKPVIYLCGPIHGRTDEECVEWRQTVARIWVGQVLDPLRRDYRGRELENVAQLVHDDLSDINAADGLVVYFDRPSVGTSMEVFYAKHVLRKPIVLVDVSGMKPLPAWLVHHVDSIHPDVHSALLELALLIGRRLRA